MQVISSAEFATHPNKYFNLAMSQDVRIRQKQKMFKLTYEPIVEDKIVLQPDDDLRRAITAEQLLDGIYQDLETFFASK